MARCCCCFGLRTGSLLIGLVLLLLDLAVLVWAALSVAADHGKIDLVTWPRQARELNLSVKTVRLCNWVVLGLSAASVLSDVLLLLGAASRRRCGQVFWLVWRALLFTLITLALLALLGIAIWLLVDKSAADTLGLHDDSLSDLLVGVISPEKQQRLRRNTYIALLVAAIVGLVIMSVLWGWFSAVDHNQRRLRHTTVIVKTQHMHTSRL